MTNLSHLNALNVRRSHERGYLSKARTAGEKALRGVWIAQIEREIGRERVSLGLGAEPAQDVSDDDLLAALEA